MSLGEHSYKRRKSKKFQSKISQTGITYTFHCDQSVNFACLELLKWHCELHSKVLELYKQIQMSKEMQMRECARWTDFQPYFIRTKSALSYFFSGWEVQYLRPSRRNLVTIPSSVFCCNKYVTKHFEIQFVLKVSVQ